MTDGRDAVYGNIESIGTRDVIYNYTGLTKREYFAAKALQGILANPEFCDTATTRSAVRCADDLIEALNAEG